MNRPHNGFRFAARATVQKIEQAAWRGSAGYERPMGDVADNIRSTYRAIMLNLAATARPVWLRSSTTVSMPSRDGVCSEILVDADGNLRCSAQIGRLLMTRSLSGERTRSSLATWHTLQVSLDFLFSVI
jgi:hypothetical protein